MPSNKSHYYRPNVNMLYTKKIPCLSLDLWDTVLRRRVHPDTIKMLTARQTQALLGDNIKPKFASPLSLFRERQKIEYQIGREEIAKGNDDEYEIKNVLQRCLQRVSKTPNKKRINQISKHLIAYEIAREIELTYPDEDLSRLVNKYDYQQLIIISDFYMGKAMTQRIVLANNINFSPDHFFISCDLGKNKRSGRLFSFVAETLDIPPQDIIHIGDNYQADFKMAKKAGFQAKQFSSIKEHLLKKKKRERFLTPCESYRRKFAPFNKTVSRKRYDVTFTSTSQKRLFNEGLQFSLFFIGFALFIDQQCRLDGHKKVFFFTREGIFFKKIFDILQQNHPLELEPIESILLPVSRMSSFFPSLREISCHELMRIWTMYPDQSLRMLFRSLNLNDKEYPAVTKQFHLDLDEIIPDIHSDERVQKLFRDKNFIEHMLQQQQRRISTVKLFFQAMGFPDKGKIIVVDIGWRGTIQDNICHIFPKTEVKGIYIGLQKYFNKQPENSDKHAYIANDNIKLTHHPLLRHVIPMEMLCSAPGGSATTYTARKGGKVDVIYSPDKKADAFYHKWIQHFQEGVLLGSTHHCGLLKRHPATTDDLRGISIKKAADFILTPPTQCSKIFLELKHDDSFGMDRTFMPKSEKIRLQDKILGYFVRDRKQIFLRNLEESGWPQALLKAKFRGILYLTQKIRFFLTSVAEKTHFLR